MSQKIPKWGGVIFIVLGVMIFLFAFGVIQGRPTDRAGIIADSHWVVKAFGVSFIGVGVSIFFQHRRNWFLFALSVVVAASFFSSIFWAVYLSGKAEFKFQALAAFPLVMGLVGTIGGMIKELILLRQGSDGRQNG